MYMLATIRGVGEKFAFYVSFLISLALFTDILQSRDAAYLECSKDGKEYKIASPGSSSACKNPLLYTSTSSRPYVH